MLASTWENQSIAPVISTVPSTMIGFGPVRPSARATTCETTPMVSATGRNAKPVLSALNSSTPWAKKVMK